MNSENINEKVIKAAFAMKRQFAQEIYGLPEKVVKFETPIQPEDIFKVEFLSANCDWVSFEEIQSHRNTTCKHRWVPMVYSSFCFYCNKTKTPEDL